MRYALGIDIGGTKISLVIGSETGRILVQQKIRTLKGKHTRLCIDQMIAVAKTLIEAANLPKKSLAGIGIGLPGAVDRKCGTVPRSPHLDGWQGIPLASILSKKLKLPVFMMNDARLAAVGEKFFGEGKDVKNFIYMTVSTGVGSGIVIDGKLYDGASYVAGEIGHMTIEPYGEPWKMGEIGPLEAYASGTAVAKYVRQKLQGKPAKQKKRYLDAKGEMSAKSIALAAIKGDSLALKAFQRAGFFLGIGVSNLLNVLNPEKIVIGGGVMKSSPAIFWKTFIRTCKERSWPEAYRAVKIVKTKLKDDVGNLGALALVFYSLNQKQS